MLCGLQGAAHVREVFGRMGFNDQEMVALIGAHSLGRCHDNRSGYLGPWTNAPTTFSNLYFKELKERTWQKKKWNGPFQYEDKESGKLMMLPADMCLLTDKKFKKVRGTKWLHPVWCVLSGGLGIHLILPPRVFMDTLTLLLLSWPLCWHCSPCSGWTCTPRMRRSSSPTSLPPGEALMALIQLCMYGAVHVCLRD